MKQRLVDVVKGMNARGMSKSEIMDNLRQMGIPDSDIDEIIKEAQPEVNIAEVHEHALETRKMIEKGEHLKPVVETLGKQEEHFERLHATVGELHEKHEEMKASIEEIKEIKKDIAQIEEELAEIKPMLAAIKRLQENLLDINKKMLLKFGS